MKKKYEVPDYSDYDIAREQKDLRAFLDSNGLYIPEDFYPQLRAGDVIDIYTTPPEMKQLYGNSQFRKLCSYTPEQMATQPFPKLFYRSDEVQFNLIKTMTNVALYENKAIKYNFENHELIENLHPNKRTFEIDLGWVAPCFEKATQKRVAPCFEKATQKRVAFINSLTVTLIFEWENA